MGRGCLDIELVHRVVTSNGTSRLQEVKVVVVEFKCVVFGEIRFLRSAR